MKKLYFSREERLNHRKEKYQENKEKRVEYNKKYRENNKEKIKEKRDKNKDKVRNGHLIKRYGISEDDYNKLLVKQNGVCAICLEPETTKHQCGTLSQLSVDHDHETGKVRGLLCRKCNVAIGYFKDSPLLTDRATKYLISYN